MSQTAPYVEPPKNRTNRLQIFATGPMTLEVAHLETVRVPIAPLVLPYYDGPRHRPPAEVPLLYRFCWALLLCWLL